MGRRWPVHSTSKCEAHNLGRPRCPLIPGGRGGAGAEAVRVVALENATRIRTAVLPANAWTDAIEAADVHVPAGAHPRRARERSGHRGACGVRLIDVDRSLGNAIVKVNARAVGARGGRVAIQHAGDVLNLAARAAAAGGRALATVGD